MTELEELQQLRALVELQKAKIKKQQEELEKKEDLIRKKDIQREFDKNKSSINVFF